MTLPSTSLRFSLVLKPWEKLTLHFYRLLDNRGDHFLGDDLGSGGTESKYRVI
jgi:hypothetical protein